MPRRIRGPRRYGEGLRHVLTPGGERDGPRVDLQTRDYLDPAVAGGEPVDRITAGSAETQNRGNGGARKRGRAFPLGGGAGAMEGRVFAFPRFRGSLCVEWESCLSGI